MNELRAWLGDNIVKMRADDITPQNLRWYVDRVVAAINRERANLTGKPGMLIQTPKTIADFVNNMAFHGMFILEPTVTGVAAFVAEPEPEPEIEKPKKVRRRKAKKQKAVTVPANGTHAI
jgi:hypothetical protein